MNENEYKFAKNIVTLDENINKALEYINENFNADATYDEETNQIDVKIKSLNEGLEAIAIKEYINNTFGDYITINI